MSEVALKVKINSLGAWAKAHGTLDNVGLQDTPTILAVARNSIEVQRKIDEVTELEQKVIQEETGGGAIALPTDKQQDPQQRLHQKMRALALSDVTLNLERLDARVLFTGKNKPSPQAIAVLLPILDGLDEVK